MSGGEKGDHYHHYNHLLQDRDYLSDLSSLFSQRPGSSGLSDDLPGGGDALLSGFIDCNGLFDYGALERAFDMPCSSSEVDPFSLQGAGVKREEMAVDGNLNESRVGDGSAAPITPITPNSSVSSSSTEAAGEEDSGRCKKDQMKLEEEGEEEKQQQQVTVSEEGGDKSKKVSKPVKNKGEKRQRQPRFAFVTKSEVDHLEDGYRWRKYGQKAVKNSPYPRSYYRCTTQKCSVKKRVERSYQDPSIVITTYEGQHIHQSPANLRGGANILPPPPPPQLSAMATSFRQELLMHQIPQVSNNRTTTMQQMEANPNIYLPNMPSATTLQQLQFQDYGLLQDIVPSFMHSNQQ